MNFINSDNINHKSLRIRTDIGDKFLNVNLDQTYESLDILSLKIYQKDIYRLFDADYGVIVGRVVGQGVGIPNVKISVFVSSEEENVINPTTLDDIKKIEALSIYPFETVYDKDKNGKVYNLLPKYKRFRGFNGFPANQYGIGASPKTPVGTFPEKEEILTNETLAYVFDKYYKFTTVTNESGDYVIVVPSNRTYTVNMSCDVTDIGGFSTSPSTLKADGYPSGFFSEDGTEINPDIPLEELPNIDIQNKTITVKPLWSQNGDNTNVGINRLDFFLIKKIKPFATVIANCFTMGNESYWDWTNLFANGSIANQENIINSILYGNAKPVALDPNEAGIKLNAALQIRYHIKADFDLRIFRIKNTVSEADAEILNDYTNSNFNDTYDKYDVNGDIELLDASQYKEFKENGNLVVILPCNRNKIITNEFGEIVSVGDDNEIGVFTSFRGYFWFDTHRYGGNLLNAQAGVKRTKLKVPQLFGYNEHIGNQVLRRPWIWKHFKFDINEIYGITQKNTVKFGNLERASISAETTGNQTGIINFGWYNKGTEENDQEILRPKANAVSPKYINFYNHSKNSVLSVTTPSFNNSTVYQASLKSQWMNFSIYFPNFYWPGYSNDDLSDLYIFSPTQSYRSTQILNGGGIGANVAQAINIGINSTLSVIDCLANGQTIKTNFFKANKEDLILLYDYKLPAQITDATGGTITENTEQLGIKLPKIELKGDYPRMNNSEKSNLSNDYINDENTGDGRLKYLNQDSGDNVGERYFLIGTSVLTTNRETNDNNVIKYLFDKVKIF